MKQQSIKNTIKVLLKSPLSCSGIFLLTIMLCLVLFIPLFTPHDPTLQRVWLGAKPPGFTHPDVLNENRFQLNTKSQTTLKLQREEVLSFKIKELKTKELRVVQTSSGKVRAIELGVINLNDFDSKDYEAIYDVNDSKMKKPLPSFTLTKRKKITEKLPFNEHNVMLLKLVEKSDWAKYTIHQKNGMVQSIDKNDEAVTQATLRGDSIIEVLDKNQKHLLAYHLLGTDELGRDLFTRILHGGRISLLVGFVATLVSLIIGVTYGAISGYFGKAIDRIMMSTVDILYAVPFMFLVIILMASFGRSLILLFVALGAVQWLTMSRIVRGQILTLKQMEFVEAAKMAGASHWQIIFKHLLPHTIGPIIVYTSLTVPVVILEESFLSFIGLQVQFNGEALDSWGTLIDQGVQALGVDYGKSWLIIYPSLAMALTLFALNAFGDGLRDALDPRWQGKNK